MLLRFLVEVKGIMDNFVDWPVTRRSILTPNNKDSLISVSKLGSRSPRSYLRMVSVFRFISSATSLATSPLSSRRDRRLRPVLTVVPSLLGFLSHKAEKNPKTALGSAGGISGVMGLLSSPDLQAAVRNGLADVLAAAAEVIRLSPGVAS